MQPNDRDAHEPHATQVGAIARLHARHERRVTRAEQVKGARVAAVDAKTASRLAPLVARCGASIVPLFADPQIVVVADQGLFEDRHALGALDAAVIEESELEAMVLAFDEFYRPASLQLALRRARTRAVQDVATARADPEGQRRERAAKGGMRSRPRQLEQPRSYAPRPLTADERALEEAARRERAA